MLLILAGLDPSGCAGLTVDIKVCQSQGIFPIAVVTCNTIQTIDSTTAAEWVDGDLFRKQLQAIFNSRMRQSIKAIKIGLLLNIELIEIFIEQYRLLRKDGLSLPIIVDPVLTSTALFSFNSIKGSKEKLRQAQKRLFELANCVMPNRDEWHELNAYIPSSTAVLITDNSQSSRFPSRFHADSCINVALQQQGKSLYRWNLYRHPIEIRGTGCALSTLTACHLIQQELSNSNDAAECDRLNVNKNTLNKNKLKRLSREYRNLIIAIDQSLSRLQNWLKKTVDSPLLIADKIDQPVLLKIINSIHD